MSLSEERADAAAHLLWDRWRTGRPGGPLPIELRPTDVADGWAVQRALLRHAGPGIGWKVAASSTAGQRHIGVSGPIAGALTADGLRPSGSTVPLTAMGAAEPEFAFRMGRDLTASGSPYTREAVLAAVAEVLPAIEIPDSRFAEPLSAGEPQLIADLACAAHFVVGEPMRKWVFDDLKGRRVVTRVNGKAVQEGRGANALGDPCDSLVWLVNAVTRLGQAVLTTDIVLTGAAAPPHPVAAGDVVSCEIKGAAPVTLVIG